MESVIAMKLPGLRPLAAIGGRGGEISYGAQNGCIYMLEWSLTLFRPLTRSL